MPEDALVNSNNGDQDREQADQAWARLETEIELLHAMYPDQITYNRDERSLVFEPAAESSDATDPIEHSKAPTAPLLIIHVPKTYPTSGLPALQKAIDPAGKDISITISKKIQALSLAEGIETLDEIIASLTDHLQTNPPEPAAASSTPPSPSPTTTDNPRPSSNETNSDPSTAPQTHTVIIWLHHLLNTSKRKLALSPPASDPPITGLTKPGYPGVLIYSGPAGAVHAHVAALKAQKWQAFQVRYDEAQGEGPWVFGHGEGVVEVGSMSEVVGGVEEGWRGVVMEALRIR